MSRERRKFSREFKVKVVQAYESGVSGVELSRQFELHPNVIYAWSPEYRGDPAKAFRDDHNDSSKIQDQRIVELERMVGRLTLENDFLKKPCRMQRTFCPLPNPGVRSHDAPVDRHSV